MSKKYHFYALRDFIKIKESFVTPIIRIEDEETSIYPNKSVIEEPNYFLKPNFDLIMEFYE